MFQLLFLIVIFAVLVVGSAHLGRPLRGHIKQTVLLCRYLDSPQVPHNITHYERLFLRRGTDGLADFWHDVSDNAIDFDGSRVVGWITVGRTVAEAREKYKNNRAFFADDCIGTSRRFGLLPYSDLIVTITSPTMDVFGQKGRAFLGDDTSVSFAAHEVAHGMGMRHSHTIDSRSCNADWAFQGEYGDRYDIMSYGNVYSYYDAEFGEIGPGLNAFHLDRMGWIPIKSIFRFGSDGVYDKDIRLVAPTSSHKTGTYQMIRIPYVPFDMQSYYTVQYRRSQSWDNGFPSDTILIHKVENRQLKKCGDQTLRPAQTRSYLLTDVSKESPVSQPLTRINQDGIRIEVLSQGNEVATVRVVSTKPHRCVVGYVAREANNADRVCVTYRQRSQVAAENRYPTLYRDPNGGPYGPDTCKQGFVWREAFEGDHVCVRYQSREATWNENETKLYRTIGWNSYGPLTCSKGLVWREADGRDYVCVAPYRRTAVRNENRLGPSRLLPGGGAYGPDTCKAPYVWREAFPGDHVCVTRRSRSTVRIENRNRTKHLSGVQRDNAAASALVSPSEDYDEVTASGVPAVLNSHIMTNEGASVHFEVATNVLDAGGLCWTSGSSLNLRTVMLKSLKTA